MGKTLVIQVHRLGDVVQSMPALRLLRGKCPQDRIVLLVRRTLAELFLNEPAVDEVIAWDEDRLWEELHDGQVPLGATYTEVADFVALLQAEGFERVINLSDGEEGRILAYLLGCDQTLGPVYSPDGVFLSRGEWAKGLYLLAEGRRYQACNLVDVFLGTAGLKGPYRGVYLSVPDEDRAFARRFLSRQGVSEGDLLIGFQLGASRDYRQWPPGNFVQLARRLSQKYGAKVLLLGTAQEKGLAKEVIEALGGGVMNAVGRTSFTQLAALLERCQLLVTGDTGPMHVAAAVGTKVVALFFATAFFHRTGPYGEGHLVLAPLVDCYPCLGDPTGRCPELPCRRCLTVETVFRASELVLSGEQREGGVELPSPRAVLYRSRFDPDGFLDFLPLSPCPLTLEEVIRRLYTKLWRKMIIHPQDRDLLPSAVAETAAELSFYHCDGLDGWGESLRERARKFKKMAELAREGAELLNQVIRRELLEEEDIELIWPLVEKVTEIEVEMNQTQPEARLLTDRFFAEQLRVRKLPLVPAAVEYRKLYQCLEEHSRYLSLGLEHLVKQLQG